MSEPVLVERSGAVAVVTLNMPEKRNALGPALYSVLSETLNRLQKDPSLRALVLHGGAHFCAGGDISAMGTPSLEMRSAMRTGQEAVRALINGPLPSVAAVEGSAFGAGFSLAMACDFVVGDDSTVFCAAFGRVGLAPDYGLLWTLPQRVPLSVAKEILLFGEPVSAAQATHWRLIDRFVERGQVLPAARELAEKLAAVAPATIATTKAALSRAPLPLETLLSWEADTQALLTNSEDTKARIKAFLERRGTGAR